MVAKSPRGDGASKVVPKLKTKIYKLEQEVKHLKENPVTVVKEVPVDVVREVIKTVEVPVEVIKNVPYEVIKEVPKEVIKEVVKRVEVPVEVIKTVEVPEEVIKTIEIPKEIIKEVTVEKEVKVFVPTEDKDAKKIWNEELNKLREEKLKQKIDFEERIALENKSKEATENRYKAAMQLVRSLNAQKISNFEEQVAKDSKKYRRLFTYAYLLTLYTLPQILWMLT